MGQHAQRVGQRAAYRHVDGHVVAPAQIVDEQLGLIRREARDGAAPGAHLEAIAGDRAEGGGAGDVGQGIAVVDGDARRFDGGADGAGGKPGEIQIAWTQVNARLRLSDRACAEVCADPVARIGGKADRPIAPQVVDRQIGHRDAGGDEGAAVEALDHALEGDARAAEIDDGAVDVEPIGAHRERPAGGGAGDVDRLAEPCAEGEPPAAGGEVEGDFAQAGFAVEGQLERSAHREAGGRERSQHGRVGGDPLGPHVGEVDPDLEVAPPAPVTRPHADLGGAPGDIDEQLGVDADAGAATQQAHRGARRMPGHVQPLVDDHQVAADDADALEIPHRPRRVGRGEQVGEQKLGRSSRRAGIAEPEFDFAFGVAH